MHSALQFGTRGHGLRCTARQTPHIIKRVCVLCFAYINFLIIEYCKILLFQIVLTAVMTDYQQTMHLRLVPDTDVWSKSHVPQNEQDSPLAKNQDYV